ncbi:NAD(P)H-hydrate epimerase-like [Oppia nitens]|uniref:NAD(P)H-hydrate epimerase-like n=1 Tax=Oppia nitens TaxID=1686743 RepID=UPI0023DB8384|nr:NAD(P)H-hydrate epimerase-like [Oppia nitens]
MSMGFTGLNRTTSNIEPRTVNYSRSNGIDEIDDIRYINDIEYEAIKDELFGEFGFTIDQITEMQGLSIAAAIHKTYPTTASGSSLASSASASSSSSSATVVGNDSRTVATKLLICCGSELLGKSGLVAARHLKLFGFRPTIYNPTPGRTPHYHRLIRQCQEFEISFLSYLPNESRLIRDSYDLVVDVMDDYQQSLNTNNQEILGKLVDVCNAGTPVASVDVPFGWSANDGPPRSSGGIGGAGGEVMPVLLPECLISMIAPKMCAKLFTGRHHWLGGRFILPSLSRKYKLNLPKFVGSEQIVAIDTHCY